ncbi:MAG TPA: class I SAM-dependent methyltransferase [Anaerolineales bacterium]|nr:class I SAM-dependent methyltransferase [Anaerolineales bacterium]
MPKKARADHEVRTSWDPLAAWYDGWVGEDGSEHHQKLAIPAVMELLELDRSDRVLDVGAGQGVLAPYVAEIGAGYVGVDAGSKLIAMARRRHAKLGDFIVGDARQLDSLAGLAAGSFSAVVFLLSLQDMDPLEPVLRGAAWALKPGGRLVALLTHPCYRIPRQSGWGWDEGRKLQYRRIDRYLTPLPVPLKPYPGQPGVSRSFHRPLSDYVNGLGAQGLAVTRMLEIPTYKRVKGERSKAINRANAEIPLFLGVRAEGR